MSVNGDLTSHGASGVDGVMFLFVALLIGLFCKVIWADVKFLREWFPLPYTVIIFIIGLTWGYCTPKYSDGGDLDDGLNRVIGIDPHLFMLAFIPPLLFEAGFGLNMHVYKKVSLQCLWLAGPGVIVCMMASAFLCYYVYPDNWNWNTCLLYGAIVAATDPVAVGAVLKELGAPESLATVIEGESLLNDGTAFVLFSVFLKRAESYQTPAEVFETVVQMSLGGAAIGLAFGILTVCVLKLNYHRSDPFFEVIITLTMPYITYWVAENPCGASGVLATVIMAMVTNRYGHFFIRHRHSLHQFWEHLSWIANTLVFIISGALVGESMYLRKFHDPGFQILNWLLLLLLRAGILFGSMPLMKHFGYGFDWKRASVATWGGLRGAVGLSMAIIVLEDPHLDAEHRTEIFDYVASLVFFTLVINGTSSGLLIRFLNYDCKSATRVELSKQARDVVVDYGKRLADQDPHANRNSSGQIDNDEFVQWAVVQTTMQKFDEQTEKAFDSFRTLPGEDGTDRDQVREALLMACKGVLAASSEQDVLDPDSVFKMEDTCDLLLDPQHVDRSEHLELKNWWKMLLQPEAQELIDQGHHGIDGINEGDAPSCSVASTLAKLPCIGRWAKVYLLRNSLSAIELALGFGDVITKVKMSRNMSSGSALAEIESELLNELLEAKNDADIWLTKQNHVFIAMAKTRKKIKDSLAKLDTENNRLSVEGLMGDAEKLEVENVVRTLRQRNHYSYGSRKLQDKFESLAINMSQNREPMGISIESTPSECEEPGPLQNMGNRGETPFKQDVPPQAPEPTSTDGVQILPMA